MTNTARISSPACPIATVMSMGNLDAVLALRLKYSLEPASSDLGPRKDPSNVAVPCYRC